MKLMIGIPVLDNVQWTFFLYTSALIGKLAKKHEVILSFVNRCAIDRAREIIVTDAIALDCDRILFIDDDTLVPNDVVDLLEPLLEPEDAISASGFCYQRGYRFLPMVYMYEDFVWGRGDNCQLIEPWPLKPFRVSATGMGVCLLKVPLLKKLEKALGDSFGRIDRGTEDFYFFQKVDEMKYTAWVHPNVEATHIGNPMMVDSKNVNQLRSDFHKKIYLPEESGGRAMKGEIAV